MNNKIIIVLFLVGTVLFQNCGSNPKIQGHKLEIFAPSKIYESLILKRLSNKGELIPVDTLKINEGKAEYIHQYTMPDIFFISNGTSNLMVFLEPEDIKMYINAHHFIADSIRGGQENRRFGEYLSHVDSLKQLQKKTLMEIKNQSPSAKKDIQNKLFALADTIRQYGFDFARHPSLAGIAVLTEMTFQNNANVKKLFEIYNNYPETLKRTNAGKFLTKRLNDISVGAIGMRARNFTAPNPDGKLISLYSAMGKVTLVDFWAAWCKPCRIENPNLVRIYDKYHEQGLNIISVSLDSDKDAWLKAIRDDKLNWYHVSHLKGWKEPVAVMYKIRAIPQNILIDKKGIIRYKNLRGKLLEQKIQELLDE